MATITRVQMLVYDKEANIRNERQNASLFCDKAQIGAVIKNFVYMQLFYCFNRVNSRGPSWGKR